MRPSLPRVRDRVRAAWQFSVSCLVFLLAAQAVPLQAQTYTNPIFFSTGSDPQTISTADLNADGQPDLVYLDGNLPFTVHILLGNGNASFIRNQQVDLPLGMGGAITIGDVNGDSTLDLILGASDPVGRIGVLLGNGDGTFGSLMTSQFSPACCNFASLGAPKGVADVNGDGAVDLIVSDRLNLSVYILLGDNSGSFSYLATVFNGSTPAEVLTSNLNGDAHIDFLVRGALGADVTVYLGQGGGSFQAGTRYAGPNSIDSVLLEDMDGDGQPDLVVVDHLDSIGILRGNSDGTFGATYVGGVSGLVLRPRLMAALDLNADSILDLVTSSANGLGVLLGQAGLAYAQPKHFSGSPTLHSFGDTAALADFNSDGHLDLAELAPGGIAIVLANGDGTFQSADVYDLRQLVQGVALADFNGDGLTDIAINTDTLQGPPILRGQAAAKFQVPTGVGSCACVGYGPNIYAGDFDGDGRADLYLNGAPVSTGVVFYGNGNLTFATPVPPAANPLTGFGRSIIADLNHDNRSDILTTDYQHLETLLGQANRSFTRISTLFLGWTGVGDPAGGHLNNDNHLDLVLGSQTFIGNGDGTFANGRILDLLNLPQATAVADFDSDGNGDVVSLFGFFARLQFSYGRGDGTFEDPVDLSISRGHAQMAVADMDNDGWPDLVLSDGSVLTVIRNTRARTFGAETNWLAGSVGRFELRDLNGDNLPDIVVANGGGATTVTVLLSSATNGGVIGNLQVSPAPSAFGEPITISLSLSAAPGAGTPSGNVTFAIDGEPIAALPVASPTTVYTLPDTSAYHVGLHTVTAAYSGDSTFVPTTFVTAHTVTPAIVQTTTMLMVSPNPVLASNTAQFVATVNLPTTVVAGVVAFHDGATTLGTRFLDTNNRAVFDTSLLRPGTHSITASYRGNTIGDVTYAASTSVPVSLVVTSYPSTTVLSALPIPAQVGEATLLTAQVSSVGGIPTGAVTFLNGSSPLGTQPLDASGSAVLTATFSSPGSRSLTATYHANATFDGSQSAVVNLPVNGAAGSHSTRTVLTVSPLSGVSTALALTASVTAQTGVPSGRIAFRDGAVILGHAIADSRGVASFPASSFSPGLHYISAAYEGSAEFLPSVSQPVLQELPGRGPYFSLNLSATSVVVPAGLSTDVLVSIVPVNGWRDIVQLSCQADTPGVQCALAPNSIAGDGSSRLRILVSSHRAGRVPSLPRTDRFVSVWMLVLTLGLGMAGIQRRSRLRHALLPLTLLGVTAMMSCGVQREVNHTPTRIHVVTVQGSAMQPNAALSQSVEVQVTVPGQGL